MRVLGVRVINCALVVVCKFRVALRVVLVCGWPWEVAGFRSHSQLYIVATYFPLGECCVIGGMRKIYIFHVSKSSNALHKVN